uniref:Uncharacterized protein n=1 Tax=Heterorhabditis bacteriophora TaxID=37862 RepID=A0A1I7WVK1_HETBA
MKCLKLVLIIILNIRLKFGMHQLNKYKIIRYNDLYCFCDLLVASHFLNHICLIFLYILCTYVNLISFFISSILLYCLLLEY